MTFMTTPLHFSSFGYECVSCKVSFCYTGCVYRVFLLYRAYVCIMCSPGVMKFAILVELSFVIITKHLVCIIHAPEQRRRFLKKYINFTLVTPKLPPFGARSRDIYNILFPHPTVAKYHIWLRLAPLFLRKRCQCTTDDGRHTTDDRRRRTPTHSNRRPNNNI